MDQTHLSHGYDRCRGEEIARGFLLPSRGRPRRVDIRAVINGIFYIVRSGCVWRMLPMEYLPGETVYLDCIYREL